MKGAYAKQPKPRAKVRATCKHCGPGVLFYVRPDGTKAFCVACHLNCVQRWKDQNQEKVNIDLAAARARRLRDNPGREREILRNIKWRYKNRINGRECRWCQRTDKETSFPVRVECQACHRRGQPSRNGRDPSGRPLYRGGKHKRVT